MRSDARGVLAALGSVRASLFLGMGTAAMLVAASFFVPNPRSRDALPFNESITGFFDPMSMEYAWFYALLAVTFAYGVNGLFGTWHSLALRGGVPDRRFAGILLMHLGFLGGLVAHLVAGLGTEVEGGALLSSTPTEVAGRTVRLLDAHEVLHPDGTLRTFTGRVDLGDGDVRTLGYNDPVFLDGFRRWILVQAPEEVAGAPRFTVSGAEAPTDASGAWVAGETRYVVERTSQHRSLRAPMVLVRTVGSDTAEWLGPGMTTAGGLRFEGLGTELAAAVVVRRNDGLPLVAGASVIFLAGLALFSADALRRPGRSG